VTDHFGVVVGGHNNQAGDNGGTPTDRFGAAVVGGSSNRARGFESFVGGGQGNIVDGIRGVITGGSFNSVNGSAGTVGGGSGNTAGGDYAIIPGGRSNTTAADYAFAAGRRAQAVNAGAFVWGDSTDADVVSPAADTFTARASGGVYFYSAADLSAGVQLPAGGGAWATISDRNVKENIERIDAPAVLEALVALPVSTWNYISQDDHIRHIGVMAQDFYAAFGVGEDERRITTIDADGVAFAAIQGLNQKLEAENAALQSRVEGLEARLAALEGLAGGGQSASLLPVVAVIGGLGLLALRRRKNP
jgi:hypothetical protein